MGRRGFKAYLAMGIVLTGLLGVICAVLASGPDHELYFEREVPTSLPIETLTQSVGTISNWPSWFYSLGKAERVDLAGRPFAQGEQTAQTGALIRLEIQPHKGQHRGSFELLVRINEYSPGRSIQMSLVEDRSGRILKLFDQLRWKIEILPGKLRGSEIARTHHWRARLLGALSERILLNQVFYPDVMALGQFTQPLPPNPYPAYGQ